MFDRYPSFRQRNIMALAEETYHLPLNLNSMETAQTRHSSPWIAGITHSTRPYESALLIAAGIGAHVTIVKTSHLKTLGLQT